jgi:hypothetical protein
MTNQDSTEITLNGFEYSGSNLIDEVNALCPSLVIDVGCGSNFFKGKIKNLIGFDKHPHDDLDYCCDINDMTVADNSVDAVLALGSLQYRDRAATYKELATVVKWVKSGGYIVMRVRPLVSESESVKSGWPYRWSKPWIDEMSQEFGLDIAKGPVSDRNKNITDLDRTVWWWKKQ